MEKCDILINGCRILKPDMTVSEEMSVAIMIHGLRKSVLQGKLKKFSRHLKHWMEKASS